MAKRKEQLETKIYTYNSYKTEMKLCENLQDLRLLVTKEYSTMILGINFCPCLSVHTSKFKVSK